MTVGIPLKTAVSVSEMAKMVGLSRARFYQLLDAGVFPTPLRNPSTNRPYFDEQLQRSCLNVRQRNCGINGEPVLFYAKRQTTATTTKKTAGKKPPHADLLDNLKGLGLAATTAQVEAAIHVLYPDGTRGIPESEIIRGVFLHVKRQNLADKVGR
jgi:hypothetical protein